MSVQRLVNQLAVGAARAGVPLGAARVLQVQGRTTGAVRRVVVNPLEYEGAIHLVAPRGETQWVLNLRASGRCTLGDREFTALEAPIAERGPLLKAYLARWGWQVRSWMADDPDAAAHPVFVLGAAQ